MVTGKGLCAQFLCLLAKQLQYSPLSTGDDTATTFEDHSAHEAC